MSSASALQDDGKESESQKLNRRRIYLHRLVGDDVRAPKTKSTRLTSWHVACRFIFYALVAMFTTHSHSNILELSLVNVGIQQSLQHNPSTFEDIETVDDIKQWFSSSFLERLRTNGSYDLPLSLHSYNRVVSTEGICPEYAAVTLTLRRVKTTTDYATTTTKRFKQLYPRAWVADSVPAGSVASDSEDMGTLTSKSDDSVKWVHTSRCTDECVDNFKQEGFRSQGGYIALVTLSASGETMVNLIDNDAEEEVTPNEGICKGIRRSAAISINEFLDSGFLDDQFSSLVVEFVTYNANLQSMSKVRAFFETSLVGIIIDKGIRAETIKLDTHEPTVKYFEVAYLVFTGCYFFEFCYRAYKSYPAFLSNIWSYINFISIVSSLTSITLWYLYQPELENFVKKPDFEKPARITRCFNFLRWYHRTGAFASLTICLRILRYLGDMNSRVKLLIRTLGMGMKNIGIYTAYIFVVFCGFVSFAFTQFSSTSLFFVTPLEAFLSCFGMFLGDLTAMRDIQGFERVAFFLPFIVFFYFVSIQMFNAIINYAYNMVSEQMEPEFEHEKRERKRKEMQRAAVSPKDMVLQQIRAYITFLSGGKKPEETTTPKDTAEAEKKRGVPEASVGVSRDKKRKAPDSFCHITLFFVFAIFYIWFLVLNLNIPDCADVKDAIHTLVQESGAFGIVSLPQVVPWIYASLAPLIFNSTTVESLENGGNLGVYREGAVCIMNWNCLVTGGDYGQSFGTTVSEEETASSATTASNGTAAPTAENATEPPEWMGRVPEVPPWARPRNASLLRITQRRSRVMKNNGCKSANTPPQLCFTGGKAEATLARPLTAALSAVLVPERLSPRPILPSSTPSKDEDTDLNYNLHLNGRTFCKSTTDKGFLGKGGIVCLLDADYGTFLQQMKVMADEDFITKGSSTFVVDFITYNGNKNMLTYTLLQFIIDPSGVVKSSEDISSMKLFDFGSFLDNWRTIALRILPGIAYIFLVFKFGYDWHWDLRQEIYRKRLNENINWFVATLEFITFDIFNLLELTSIMISIVSFFLFCLWIGKEQELASKLERPYDELLDYVYNLAWNEKIYNILSALNMLLIFIRPLKFVRDSVRMAQLYQTLWDAQKDIIWFVIMFLVTMLGFVMFAYVTFGAYFVPCSTFDGALNYCFGYILGNFEFYPLYEADWLMAIIFFFPFLLLFYLVFLNIFFAIIDRYFIPVDPPPLNLKRRLKPIFQRVCRCIEWDEDYVMEQDPRQQKQAGPPSRQSKVKKWVQEINASVGENDSNSGPKKAFLLSEVCDADERMGDVLHWSREEAGKVVNDFQKLLQKKRTVKNDEVFIKTEVINHIRQESKSMRESMEEAERLMRYATNVHEQLALRDQETLAKYILILELKIRNRMKQRHELETQVKYLHSESNKMRYTHEELTQHTSVAQVRNSDRWAAEEKRAAEESSDEDPALGEPGTSAAGPSGGHASIAVAADGAGGSAAASAGALQSSHDGAAGSVEAVTKGDGDLRAHRQKEAANALLGLRTP